MKLLFKQRFFSWFDSYDIYNEQGNIYFSVNGQLSFGHMFDILDRNGNKVGLIKEQIFRFLPHYDMYIEGNKIGEIVKEFSFFTPVFSLSLNDWICEGDFFQWDYRIKTPTKLIATISKKLWNFTDTYELDIVNDKNDLLVLMVVLSIDAAKCSRSKN